MELDTPPSGRDSQIGALSCSLSLISEPPCIGEWFSSYVYESPSLGTDEGLLGSVLDEREREDNGWVVDERKKGGGEEVILRDLNRIGGTSGVSPLELASNFGSNKLEEESPTELPDSLESSLQISEPPDVREWFSSYVYESPELSEYSREFFSIESECNYKRPVTGESKKEHENLGEVIEGKNGDVASAPDVPQTNGPVYNGGGSFLDQDRENQTLTKIADSISPSLLLSEPPDITNWFSNYVYQSPELSTFPGSPVEENGDGKDDLILKEVIGEQKEDNPHNSSGNRIEGGTGIKQRLNSALCSGSHEDLEHEYQHTQDEAKEDNDLLRRISCPEIIEGRMEFKALLSSDRDCKNKGPKQHHSEKAICFHSNNNENSSNAERKALGELIGFHSNNNEDSSNAERKALRELIGRFEDGSGLKAQGGEVAHTLLEGSLGFNPVDQASMRTSTHGGCGKENRRDNDDAVFVTIRKKELTRANDELMRPQRALHQCSHARENVSSTAIKDKTRMKPLSEITNFQSNSHVQESTGIWKCPQKRKPILGPPLKQLRLERWIHRI